MAKIQAKGFINKNGDQVEMIPTPHTHVITDVTNLQTELDGKANTGHSHTIANVIELQTILNNKANWNNSTVLDKPYLLTSLPDSTHANDIHVSTLTEDDVKDGIIKTISLSDADNISMTDHIKRKIYRVVSNIQGNAGTWFLFVSTYTISNRLQYRQVLFNDTEYKSRTKDSAATSWGEWVTRNYAFIDEFTDLISDVIDAKNNITTLQTNVRNLDFTKLDRNYIRLFEEINTDIVGTNSGRYFGQVSNSSLNGFDFNSNGAPWIRGVFETYNLPMDDVTLQYDYLFGTFSNNVPFEICSVTIPAAIEGEDDYYHNVYVTRYNSELGILVYKAILNSSSKEQYEEYGYITLTFSLIHNTHAISDITGLQAALDGKMPNKTIDNVPTQDSNNLISSKGVYNALNKKLSFSVIYENKTTTILTQFSPDTETTFKPGVHGGEIVVKRYRNSGDFDIKRVYCIVHVYNSEKVYIYWDENRKFAHLDMGDWEIDYNGDTIIPPVVDPEPSLDTTKWIKIDSISDPGSQISNQTLYYWFEQTNYTAWATEHKDLKVLVEGGLEVDEKIYLWTGNYQNRPEDMPSTTGSDYKIIEVNM